MIVLSRDCKIKLRDIHSFNCLNLLKTDHTPVLCFSLLQNDNYASAFANCSIFVWNATTHEKVISLKGHKGSVL